jgi:hypothetical protein
MQQHWLSNRLSQYPFASQRLIATTEILIEAGTGIAYLFRDTPHRQQLFPFIVTLLRAKPPKGGDAELRD